MNWRELKSVVHFVLPGMETTLLQVNRPTFRPKLIIGARRSAELTHLKLAALRRTAAMA